MFLELDEEVVEFFESGVDVADGVRDTLIEVSSAGAVSAFAHCWYIESLEAEPAAPPDVPQVPAWTLIDFELALTQLEPIVWDRYVRVFGTP